MKRIILLIVLLFLAVQSRADEPKRLIDVTYGSHPRQVFDFYQAKSDKPTPLVLFIHGGGFRGGSKRSVNPKPFLDAGISLAAIEYRFVQHKRLPAAHDDCRRAIQFLRHRAQHYNLDKTRIGAFGGSEEIMRLFENFNQVGVSVLIASHDLELIKRMDHRILTLHQGRMFEQSSWDIE